MARVRRQAAVIPYRIRKARLEVALVTTSNGKGWIVKIKVDGAPTELISADEYKKLI